MSQRDPQLTKFLSDFMAEAAPAGQTQFMHVKPPEPLGLLGEEALADHLDSALKRWRAQGNTK